MLKIITAFVFMSAFASQTFYKAFIVFDYAANTRSYAKKCVNKARPKMHCNGKCQMMKKLDAEEKKEAQNTERKMENKQENILSSRSFFASVQINQVGELQHYALLPEEKTCDFPHLIFRPPGA